MATCLITFSHFNSKPMRKQEDRADGKKKKNRIPASTVVPNFFAGDCYAFLGCMDEELKQLGT